MPPGWEGRAPVMAPAALSRRPKGWVCCGWTSGGAAWRCAWPSASGASRGAGRHTSSQHRGGREAAAAPLPQRQPSPAALLAVPSMGGKSLTGRPSARALSSQAFSTAMSSRVWVREAAAPASARPTGSGRSSARLAMRSRPSCSSASVWAFPGWMVTRGGNPRSTAVLHADGDVMRKRGGSGGDEVHRSDVFQRFAPFPIAGLKPRQEADLRRSRLPAFLLVSRQSIRHVGNGVGNDVGAGTQRRMLGRWPGS